MVFQQPARPRQAVARAAEHVHMTGGKILGVILNDADQKISSYGYGYGYGSYHSAYRGYHSSAAES